jgi:hypothetical protein
MIMDKEMCWDELKEWLERAVSTAFSLTEDEKDCEYSVRWHVKSRALKLVLDKMKELER